MPQSVTIVSFLFAATFLFATFLETTSAYQITSPSNVSSWTTAGPNTITWERVSTDPESFAIVLVNENRNVLPVNNQLLVASVDGTLLSIAVTPPAGSTFPPGNNFRVNFVKSSNDVDTIYAQSNEFEIVGNGNSNNATSMELGGSSSFTAGMTTSMTTAIPHTTYTAPLATETVTTTISASQRAFLYEPTYHLVYVLLAYCCAIMLVSPRLGYF